MEYIYYDNYLKNNIAKEMSYEDFIFSFEDEKVLHEMLKKINAKGYSFNFLAELEHFRIPNLGYIIGEHIFNFQSETTRAYLVTQMVIDKVNECDEVVLKLYNEFKNSKEYISPSGKPAPAHIYVRYDNAIKTLKPKRLCGALVDLVANPRDAFYLPATLQMLSSWKHAEIEKILLHYLNKENINPSDVGLPLSSTDMFYPSLEYIRSELRNAAITGLRYFPSEQNLATLEPFLHDTKKDVQLIAKKTIDKIKKHLL